MSFPSPQLFGQLPPPTQQAAKPRIELSTQIEMSEQERKALGRYIRECFETARTSAENRTDQSADEERLWRDWVGLPGGEEGHSNFRVPLINAIIFAKHAREVAAVFGSNPGVQAVPQMPVDIKTAKKVALGMKWQLYENSKALKPLALSLLRRLRHGYTVVWLPWRRKFFNRVKLDDATGQRKTERVLYWEGMEINSLTSDEVFLPPTLQGRTYFNNIQTCEYLIRRYFALPSEMRQQNSEPGGPTNPEGDNYQRVLEPEIWRKIMSLSYVSETRYAETDKLIQVQDQQEKTERSATYQAQRPQLECLEWHGEWYRWADDEEEENDKLADVPTTHERLSSDSGRNTAISGDEEISPTPENAEANSNGDFSSVEGADQLPVDAQYSRGPSLGRPATFRDRDGRLKYAAPSNLIVRYFPDLNEVLGIQDADEVYPNTPMKRPFVILRLLNDGQTYPMSLTEMLGPIEDELTVLANQIIESVDMSIGAPILAERALGEGLAQAKWEKNSIIWVANAAGAKQLQINPNVQPFQALWQMFMTLQEMLTGITQQAMGRSLEQPNAPRTLGGQRLVMGAGDVRQELDLSMMHEDLKQILDYLWDSWTMFGSEQEFFRVTEGDSHGAFQQKGLPFRVDDKDAGGLEASEMHHGWAMLTDKERAARYDWSLNFADDAAVKEQKKQDLMGIANILAQFPLAAENKALQHRFLNEFLETFGFDPAILGPEPPAPFEAMMPEHEWSLMLRGEDPHVHPDDDDQAHIADHENRLLAMIDGPEEDRNEEAGFKMQQHIDAHKEQMARKAQMQALMQLAQAIAPGLAGGQPGGPQQANPLQALLGAGNTLPNQPPV